MLSVVQSSTAASGSSAPEDFVVRSPEMVRLYEFVKKAAPRNIPVLITGETGVGKEHVARSLHDLGDRRGPFVAVNCGAMPAQLVESVLFGHEKGAFTGADRQTKGMFEQAEGGTVFLDEIGELNHRAQTALLRVLQEKRVARVGSHHEFSIDCRVVAATHRDLASMVSARTFRDDLYYRLTGAEVFVPPLRERKEEIPLLASVFLRKATAESEGEACFIGEPAMAALLEYSWPGNVRQLWNVIQFAAVVRKGPQIRAEDLPDELHPESCSGVSTSSLERSAATDPRLERGRMSLRKRVQEYEAALIREGLALSGGRITEAARLLSIPVRTLNNKLSAYGIRPSARVPLDDAAPPLMRPPVRSSSSH